MRNDILEAIEEMTGSKENIKDMSKREIFKTWLEYEGILGYDRKIISIIEDVFEVELDRRK